MEHQSLRCFFVVVVVVVILCSGLTMEIHPWDNTHATTRSSVSVENGPLDIKLCCPQVDEFNYIFFHKQNA